MTVGAACFLVCRETAGNKHMSIQAYWNGSMSRGQARLLTCLRKHAHRVAYSPHYAHVCAAFHLVVPCRGYCSAKSIAVPKPLAVRQVRRALANPGVDLYLNWCDWHSRACVCYVWGNAWIDLIVTSLQISKTLFEHVPRYVLAWTNSFPHTQIQCLSHCQLVHLMLSLSPHVVYVSHVTSSASTLQSFSCITYTLFRSNIRATATVEADAFFKFARWR